MSSGYSIYWDTIKKELQGIISTTDMQLWIDRLSFHSFDEKEHKLKIQAPSSFIKDNALKFKAQMTDILTHLYGHPCLLEIIINKASTIEKKEEQIVSVMENSLDVKPEKVKPDVPKSFDQNSLYTFDSFIIGNSNEFAAHAAKVVAENPGSISTYNPFLIYGPSGLGKTHLLKAVESYVKLHLPTKKVKYITSEEFLNDFVNSIRNTQQEQFRIKYRQLDVLLIDDVQFFVDKAAIQEEFFNTFNKLKESNKQMIFTCDKPIAKVKLEERIKGRLNNGLTVDLRPPDYELQLAILKNLSEKHQLIINDDAMEFICSNNVGSIRELIGNFNDLLAFSSIMKIDKITIEIAKSRLKDKITKTAGGTPVSVDKIIHIVAEYYNLKSHDITGNKRTKSIAIARQTAMYLSRKLTRLSTTQIGTYFGDKEHGTVMHATKKMEELMTHDNKTKNDIEFILTRIKTE